jgi:hypothetical protein
VTKLRLLKCDPDITSYRGQPLVQELDLVYAAIGGVAVGIVQLANQEWWIAPALEEDDEVFASPGAFDTPELAWSTLQLLKD